MADKLATSILVGISAIKAAAALGSWYDNRRQNRTAYYSTDVDGTQIVATSHGLTEHIDKLFLVMSNLGQRLLALDAIDREHLPIACEDVSRAFSKCSPTLSSAFDSLDEVMQATITCAVSFCSACHPMPMYRGFGCGVLNDTKWANPVAQDLFDSDILLDMDDTIAYYKSVPQDYRLLYKSPSRISRVRPYYHKTSKADRKLYMRDVYSMYERKGFPQPLDKNLSITSWEIPFATWNGKAMYDHQYHNVESALRWQLDPGRFLYAWTVGERLDLVPGEAVIPLQEHIGALAAWLENHRGMTFTVLYDQDLEDKHKTSHSRRRSIQASPGNLRGTLGKFAAIVCDPRKFRYQDDNQASFEKVPSRSMSIPMRQPESLPPSYASYPQSPRSYSMSNIVTPPLSLNATSWQSSSTSDSVRRKPIPETTPSPPSRPVIEDIFEVDDLDGPESAIVDHMV